MVGGPCAAHAYAQAYPAASEPARAPAAASPQIPLAGAIVVAPGATCLAADVLIRRVARWLRRDMIDIGLRVELKGSLTRKNVASFAIVRRDGRRFERRFDDGPLDCDQFHSALALSIALAIDAALSGDAFGPREGSMLPADEDLLAAPEHVAPPYFKLAFGILGQATAGVLTSVSGALSARVDVGFVPWLDLRATLMGTRLDDQTFATAPGRFAMTLLAGQVDACLAHAVAPRLRFRLCAGGAVGALHSRGHDDTELDGLSDVQPWIALDGGIEAQAELLSWFALVVNVDLVVPLAKQRIVVTGAERAAVAGQRELTAVGVLVGAGPLFRIF